MNHPESQQLVVAGVPLSFVLGLTALALGGGIAWWAYARSKQTGDEALRTAARADLVDDPQVKEALARQAFEMAARAREQANLQAPPPSFAAQQAAEEQARRAAAAQALRAKKQAAEEVRRAQAASQAEETRRAATAQAIRAMQQAAEESRRVAAAQALRATQQATATQQRSKVAMWRDYLATMARLGISSEEVIKRAEAQGLEQKVKGVFDALIEASRQAEAEKLAAITASGWW
jgi:type IV secretory pathway VirB10-like protein